MVKIVRFHKTGGPNVLQIDDCSLDSPGPDEVTVRVKAFGINRSECMLRNGSYIFQPVTPCRIGFEGTGTIESVGNNVTAHDVGDDVSIIPFAVANEHGFWQSMPKDHGTYGEITTVPVSAVIKIPKTVSTVINAAAWHQYLTAWGGLMYYGCITPDDIVLVTAASSSAEIGGKHLAKERGAMVIAVTTSPEKIDKISSIGADHVFLLNDVSFKQEVYRVTEGKGVTLIYDPIAGNLTNTIIDVAAPEARIICYGNLDRYDSCFPTHNALKKRISIKFYSWGDIARRPKELREAHSYVYSNLSKGVFNPIIDTIFYGLESCIAAHERMEANSQVGKIVVKI